MIRHERSRVRHSSQKNHIRWGLRAFNNLSLDYDFESFEAVNDTQLDVGNSTMGGNLTSEIEFGKMDLDYGPNLIRTRSKLDRIVADPPMLLFNPNNGTYMMRKKLGKKEIMANIRKNINKGLEYLKMHANLTEITMNDQPPPQPPSNQQNYNKNHNHNNSSKSTSFLDNFPGDAKNMNNNLNQSFPNNNKSTVITTTSTSSAGTHTSVPSNNHNDKGNRNNLVNTQNKNKEIHHRHQQQHHGAIKNIVIPKTITNEHDNSNDDADNSRRLNGGMKKVIDNNVVKIVKVAGDDSKKLLISQIESENSYQVNFDDDDVGGDDGGGGVNRLNGDGSSHKSKKKLMKLKKLPASSSHFNRHVIDENDEIVNNGSDGSSGGGSEQVANNDQENFIKFYQQNFSKFDESASLDYTNDNFDVVNDESGTELEEEIRENVSDNDDEQAVNINGYKLEDIDLKDLDETSRNNRINLMRGKDVVTRFLQIVETQHLLGANCTAGTALNLGEGVVDRYAQDRFRIEAEVAVNRANMLTR